MKKLKGKKQIERLFEEGASITDFPLRLIYLESENSGFGVSVGKRNFKLAVQRNRIKRQLRAAARDHLFHTINDTKRSYCFMAVYIGKNIPNWDEIGNKFKNVAKKIKQKNL